MQVRARPGSSSLIEPAGEMWSVVTLSPSMASTRAPSMSVDAASARRGMPSKYGGLRTYVESLVPREAVAGRAPSSAVPALVALEDLAVALAEHVRLHGLLDGLRDLLLATARCRCR